MSNVDELGFILGGTTPASKKWLSTILRDNDYNLSNVLMIIKAFDESNKIPSSNSVNIIRKISTICHGFADPIAKKLMPSSSISDKNINEACEEIILFLARLIDADQTADKQAIKSILKSLADVVQENTSISISDTSNTNETIDTIIFAIGSLCPDIITCTVSKLQAMGRILQADKSVMKHLREFLSKPEITNRMQDRDKRTLTNIFNFLDGIHETSSQLLLSCRDKIGMMLNNKAVENALEGIQSVMTHEQQDHTRTVLEMMISLTALNDITEMITNIDKNLGAKIKEFREQNPDLKDAAVSLIDQTVRTLGPTLTKDQKSEIEMLLSILTGSDIMTAVHGGGSKTITLLDKSMIDIIQEQRKRPIRGRRANAANYYQTLYAAVMSDLTDLVSVIDKNKMTLKDNNLNKHLVQLSKVIQTITGINIVQILAAVSERGTISMQEFLATAIFMYDIDSVKMRLEDVQECVKTGKHTVLIAPIKQSLECVNRMQNAIFNLLKTSKRAGVVSENDSFMIMKGGDKHMKIRKVKLMKGGQFELQDEEHVVSTDGVDISALPRITPELHHDSDGNIIGGKIGNSTGHALANKFSGMKIGDILLMVQTMLEPARKTKSASTRIAVKKIKRELSKGSTKKKTAVKKITSAQKKKSKPKKKLKITPALKKSAAKQSKSKTKQKAKKAAKKRARGGADHYNFNTDAASAYINDIMGGAHSFQDMFGGMVSQYGLLGGNNDEEHNDDDITEIMSDDENETKDIGDVAEDYDHHDSNTGRPMKFMNGKWVYEDEFEKMKDDDDETERIETAEGGMKHKSVPNDDIPEIEVSDSEDDNDDGDDDEENNIDDGDIKTININGNLVLGESTGGSGIAEKADRVVKLTTAKNIGVSLESVLKNASTLRAIGYDSELNSIVDKSNIDITIRSSQEIATQFEEELKGIEEHCMEEYKPLLPMITKEIKKGLTGLNMLNAYIGKYRKLNREILSKRPQGVELVGIGSPKEMEEIIVGLYDAITARPYNVYTQSLTAANQMYEVAIGDNLKHGNRFDEECNNVNYDMNQMFPTRPPTFDMIIKANKVKTTIESTEIKPFTTLLAHGNEQLKYIMRETGINTDELRRMFTNIIGMLTSLYKGLMFIPAKVVKTLTAFDDPIDFTRTVITDAATDDNANYNSAITRRDILDGTRVPKTLHTVYEDMHRRTGGYISQTPAITITDNAGNVTMTPSPQIMNRRYITEQYVMTWAGNNMRHVRESPVIDTYKDLFQLLSHAIRAIYSTILAGSVKDVVDKMPIDISTEKMHNIGVGLMLIGGADKNGSKAAKVSPNLKVKDILMENPEGPRRIRQEVMDAVFDPKGEMYKDFSRPIEEWDKWSETVKSVALVLYGGPRSIRLAKIKQQYSEKDTAKGGLNHARIANYISHTRDRPGALIPGEIHVDPECLKTTYTLMFAMHSIAEKLSLVQHHINQSNPTTKTSIILSEISGSKHADIINIMRSQMLQHTRKMQVTATVDIFSFEIEAFAELYRNLQQKVKGKTHQQITMLINEIYSAIYSSIGGAAVSYEDILKLTTDEGDDYINIDANRNQIEEYANINDVTASMSVDYNRYNADTTQTMGLYSSTPSDLNKAIDDMAKNVKYNRALPEIIKSLIEHHKNTVKESLVDNSTVINQHIDDVLDTLSKNTKNEMHELYIKFIRAIRPQTKFIASSTDVMLKMFSEIIIEQYEIVEEICQTIILCSTMMPIKIVEQLVIDYRDDNNRIISWPLFAQKYRDFEGMYKLFCVIDHNKYTADFLSKFGSEIGNVIGNADNINLGDKLAAYAQHVLTTIPAQTSASEAARIIVENTWPIHAMSTELIKYLSMYASSSMNSKHSFGIKFNHQSYRKAEFEHLINNITMMLAWFQKEVSKSQSKVTQQLLEKDVKAIKDINDRYIILNGTGKKAKMPPLEMMQDMIKDAYTIWNHKHSYVDLPNTAILAERRCSILHKLAGMMYPYQPFSPHDRLPGTSIKFSDPISQLIRYTTKGEEKTNLFQYRTNTLSRLEIYTLSQLDANSGVISNSNNDSTLSVLSQIVAGLINAGIRNVPTSGPEIIIDWISEINAVVGKYATAGLYPDFMATIIDVASTKAGNITSEGDRVGALLDDDISPLSHPVKNKSNMPHFKQDGTGEVRVELGAPTIMGIPQGGVVVLDSIASTLRSLQSLIQNGPNDKRMNNVSLLTSTASISKEARERISASCLTAIELFDTVICRLHALKTIMRNAPIELFDPTKWKNYRIVLNPCVNAYENNATDLISIRNMNESQIKDLLYRGVDTQLDFANDLMDVVKNHLKEVTPSDYFCNVNYTGSAASKQISKGNNVEKMSTLMKSIQQPIEYIKTVPIANGLGSYLNTTKRQFSHYAGIIGVKAPNMIAVPDVVKDISDISQMSNAITSLISTFQSKRADTIRALDQLVVDINAIGKLQIYDQQGQPIPNLLLTPDTFGLYWVDKISLPNRPGQIHQTITREEVIMHDDATRTMKHITLADLILSIDGLYSRLTRTTPVQTGYVIFISDITHYTISITVPQHSALIAHAAEAQRGIKGMMNAAIDMSELGREIRVARDELPSQEIQQLGYDATSTIIATTSYTFASNSLRIRGQYSDDNMLAATSATAMPALIDLYCRQPAYLPPISILAPKATKYSRALKMYCSKPRA